MENDRYNQQQRSTATVSGYEVQILLAKFDRAAPFLPLTISRQDLSSPHKDARNNPPKHLLQLESMVNHLQSHHLLNQDATYLEFGCGTAKLSDFISERLQGQASHVLIDRQSFSTERKRDAAIRARHNTNTKDHTVTRLTMNIQDLTSSSIPQLSTSSFMVAVSKHLCGPAADATMQYLSTASTITTNTGTNTTTTTNASTASTTATNTTNTTTTTQNKIPLLVATCCHYSCRLDSYCNVDFIIHHLGFTNREFEIITILSAWASIKLNKNEVCQQLQPTTVTTNNDNAEEPFPPPLPMEPLSPHITITTPTTSSQDFERNFTRQQKQQLGKRCKVLLDTGRAHYLVKLGYKVRLVQYTTLSMEDHLIIAIPQ